MDSEKGLLMLDNLEDHIDDLEEVLAPIMAVSLSASSKKLPLLDKAKLHVTVVYAIESLLFSYLKLNGVDAKDHPVFRELTRVKQYFEKLKVAEDGPNKPRENMNLNKQAAARIIQHALAGNDKFDLERKEREAREKFLANRKLRSLEAAMKGKAAATEIIPTQEQILEEVSALPDLEIDNGDQDEEGEIHESEPEIDMGDSTGGTLIAENDQNKPQKKSRKRKEKRKADAVEGQSSKFTSEQKAEKKARKKAKREADSAMHVQN